MNDYCLTLNVYKSQGKVKVDYGLIPVSQIENKPSSWESLVSDEIFKDFKKKGRKWIKIIKYSTGIKYGLIIKDNPNMEIAEKNIIKIGFNDFCKYLLFHPIFKKKLKERKKQLLLSL